MQSTDKQTIKINFKINGGTMAALVGHMGAEKHNFKSNTAF